jgi:RimJ/RimL family protein N-acetyltransferase
MHVRSLAWRSDVALRARAGSHVDDRGDHLVVRTPANPTFYWGNFLLLAAPPSADSVAHWVAVFEDAFPGAGHRSFGVDGCHGTLDDLGGFRDAGLGTEVSTVLTAHVLATAPPPVEGAVVRPLAGDDDWEQQVELSMSDPHLAGGREFATRRARAERGLVEDGHGVWLGAFLDGVLAASLGVFVASTGLARYQGVQTHPAHRRRGLCTALVHAAGRHALAELGAQQLVIVADPDDDAVRIYRRAGFRDVETQLQAGRWPRG